jgi:hypothetical protein
MAHYHYITILTSVKHFSANISAKVQPREASLGIAT